MLTLEDFLALPTEADVERALGQFGADDLAGLGTEAAERADQLSNLDPRTDAQERELMRIRFLLTRIESRVLGIDTI